MSQSSKVSKSFGSVSAGIVSASNMTVTKAAVTQATSISTAVTANAHAGIITTVSASTAAGSSATFTVNSSKVLSSSCVVASIVSYAGAGNPTLRVGSIANGSFTLTLSNLDTATNAAAFNGIFKISFMIV
jgi:hypothetical protein